MATLIDATKDRGAVSPMMTSPTLHSSKEPMVVEQTETSRAALMQMIYMLLMIVGENMSKIEVSYSKSQLSQQVIAQAQVNETKRETTEYLQKMKKLHEEEAKAKKWDTFASVMKYIGVAVGILVGGLLCETPLGFMMVAAVVAFTASPLFDKSVNALGSAIGSAIGSSTWGRVLAQVIIIVGLTVVTCGAEGLSTGLSKLATSAGEDVAEDGAQAAAKASLQDFKPKWSFSSATVFTQTLTSSNLLGELITQLIEKIPGNENSKKWAEVILTVVADLAVTLLSFKAAGPSGGGLVSSLQKLTSTSGDPTMIRSAVAGFVGLTQVTSATAEGGQGYNTYEQSVAQEQLAPVKGRLMFGEGFLQIINQLINLGQQTYKSILETNTTLFRTNFSADLRACVEAQYQG